MAQRPTIPPPHALEGRTRTIAATLHRLAVSGELALNRALDAIGSRPPAGHALTSELTALVKTFERPYVVRRLAASARRLYPELAILVVDDSREPVALEGVTTIRMDYDSGVSAGRNEGLRRVETKYVLVLDDDFVFYRHTRLGPALELMERNPGIDIMGGSVVDVPLMRSRRSPAGEIFPTDATPLVPLGSRVGGLEVVDKVPTFYIARTQRLALVGWDPELRMVDHADFFTRALGRLVTVRNPGLKCLHARTPFDAHYMAKRMDLESSYRRIDEVYGA
jgi:hypothetical protein